MVLKCSVQPALCLGVVMLLFRASEYLNPWKGKSLGMVYHDKYIVFRVNLRSERGGLELGNVCWSI